MTLLSRLFGGGKPASSLRLDPDRLARLLRDPEPPLVIDVRGPDEFSGPLGHIPGARNIPLDQLSGHAADLIRENRHLVMVCHTDRRSFAAAEQLNRVGAADLSVLIGGMVAWRALHVPNSQP